MKKYVTILSVLLMSNSSFAACDFANDIKSNSDGTYTYTKECHIEVGKYVKKVPILEKQVLELEKTIELKDLALTKQKERADMWMNTSLEVNEKLQKYESVASTDRTLHFIMGVGVTVLSVWAAGQIAK